MCRSRANDWQCASEGVVAGDLLPYNARHAGARDNIRSWATVPLRFFRAGSIAAIALGIAATGGCGSDDDKNKPASRTRCVNWTPIVQAEHVAGGEGRASNSVAWSAAPSATPASSVLKGVQPVHSAAKLV